MGVVALSLIRSENRALNAVTLDGMAATPANVGAGTYRLLAQFHLVTRPEPSSSVKRFMAFLQSAAGREILVRTGHWVP